MILFMLCLAHWTHLLSWQFLCNSCVVTAYGISGRSGKVIWKEHTHSIGTKCCVNYPSWQQTGNVWLTNYGVWTHSGDEAWTDPWFSSLQMHSITMLFSMVLLNNLLITFRGCVTFYVYTWYALTLYYGFYFLCNLFWCSCVMLSVWKHCFMYVSLIDLIGVIF